MLFGCCASQTVIRKPRDLSGIYHNQASSFLFPELRYFFPAQTFSDFKVVPISLLRSASTENSPWTSFLAPQFNPFHRFQVGSSVPATDKGQTTDSMQESYNQQKETSSVVPDDIPIPTHSIAEEEKHTGGLDPSYVVLLVQPSKSQESGASVKNSNEIPNLYESTHKTSFIDDDFSTYLEDGKLLAEEPAKYQKSGSEMFADFPDTKDIEAHLEYEFLKNKEKTDKERSLSESGK